uniref:Fc receptor-like protein 5 n=1 Tax=Larimichthys crocea TaxID=215358 RepID=A0A0F8C7U6_LARCR
MRRIKGAVGPCVLKSSGPCEITSSFSMDSGEYWCEYQDIKRSNPINITVTDAAFVHIVPSRLQFFEHEFVFIYCDGFFNDLTKWRVMKKMKETTTTCKSKPETPGPCNITTAFSFDSGEYWCEAEGKKSNVVDITVTDASFPRIVPSRLQFFEYEFVFINCDELSFFNETEWRVMRKFDDRKTICNVKWEKTGSCNITSTFAGDSGEYWCQAKGKTSSIVNIVVTVIRASLLLVMQVQDSDSAQKACAGCPDVIPNRLQHFEYQAISFNCEVLDGSLAWAVKRKSSSGNITCGTNWGVAKGSGCHIRDVYVEDSGEYWCETKDGKTSKSVNIAVTDAVFLHVVPNRLQFFEYEHISFNCTGRHGPAEWRVMRKSSSKTSRWETSTGCLNIQPAFVSHSGEYWCEDGEGRRSNSVNITIKGGGVILESPALPVMEQQNVTLRCTLKGTSSNLPADFIKEGHMDMVTYKGEMTIYNVSKSDEGLYKCRISGREESAGSWLAVRGKT